MSRKNIESMTNFKYFIKLKKTRKKIATDFFSSFFSSQISKKHLDKNLKKYNNFNYQSNQETSEEILINELQKPINNDINKFRIPSGKINKFLNNSNNIMNIGRNINTMLNIIKKNKKCMQYFAFNSLDEKNIRLLLAFSTYEHYEKGAPIYRVNTKPNSLYLVINGKVSTRSLNPDKIKNETHKNEYKFSTIFNQIEIEDKLNDRILYNDNISLENFVSKTNILINQQEDKNISYKNNKKIQKTLIENENNEIFKKLSNIYSLNLNDNNENSNYTKVPVRKRFRRSFTKDFSLFKSETNIISKRIVENNLFTKNLIELQRNLSCEINSYVKGDFFGDIDLILDRTFSETAYAEENTDLLVLNKKYFDKYFLKHFIKTDIERKSFLTKRIEFLHANNVQNLKPRFYDKDKIVYTQFDYANDFYIIYKGRGALKQISMDNCKKKSDVIFHKNDMKTICLVDKGCVVGLEACKSGKKKYDNNFIIIEDNTIIYSIKMTGTIDDNYLKKSNRIELKKELDNLYLLQNVIFPQTHSKKNKLTKDEIRYLKQEKKISNLFFNAKDYFWKNYLNKKQFFMKEKNFGDLKIINNNKNYFKSNKRISINKISNKIISRNFDNQILFLTLNNKKQKECSVPSINTIYPEKSDESRKYKYNEAIKSERNASTQLSIKNYMNQSNSKFKIYKNILFYNGKTKNNKLISLKKKINKNNFISLSEKKTTKENNFIDFHSFENNNKKNKSLNNTQSLLFKLKKRTNLTIQKNIVDKYISKLANIPNKKDINYDSGYFRIPLIGIKSINNLK